MVVNKQARNICNSIDAVVPVRLMGVTPYKVKVNVRNRKHTNKDERRNKYTITWDKIQS